jgi:hypothetical protein
MVEARERDRYSTSIDIATHETRTEDIACST